VPSLIGRLEGCSFRDRCPHVREVCAQTVPVRAATNGQRWRCVLEELPQ
jgi:peptide/nickel transport system ATP-binding protein